MVTTRSADKRNNPTQDELVLRSKAAQSPSSTSSTPTKRSRKRATDASSSPRSKRVRLGPEGTQTESQEGVPTGNPVAAHPTEEASHNEITNEISNEASNEDVLQRAQLEPPLDSLSTPKRVVTDQSTTGEAKGNPPLTLATQPSSETDLKFFTPVSTAHKRFASQEPEDGDTAVGETGTTHTGTDSSVHQEYQTAEEELIDSDEAPDVETSKGPSSNLIRGSSRTSRRKKAGKTLVGENVLGDIAEDEIAELSPASLAGPAALTLPPPPPPPTDTPDLAVEITMADAPAQQQSPSHPPEHVVNPPQDQSTTLESSSSSTPAKPHIPTATATAEITTFEPSEQPPAPPKAATPEPQPDLPLSLSLSSPPTDAARNMRSHITDLAHLPLTRNESPQFRDLSSSTTRFPQASSASLLPRKSRTTLSSYRRALLENRARRSGGAFRLEASWAKKRSSFAV